MYSCSRRMRQDPPAAAALHPVAVVLLSLAFAIIFATVQQHVPHAHAQSLAMQRQVETAPWTARSRAALSTLNEPVPFRQPTGERVFYAATGSMILFGGQDANSAFNDVWLSQDSGTSWSLVSGVAGSTNSHLPTSSFQARFHSATCEDPTSDRFFSLSGSTTASGAATSAVWTTPDGLRWSSPSQGGSAVASIESDCTVDSTGIVYSTGGRNPNSPSTVLQTQFSADHGVTWTQIAASATESITNHTSLIAYSPFLQTELLYTFGGQSGSNSQLSNKVFAYKLPSGPLHLVTTAAAWSPRAGLASVVTRAGVLLIAGGMTSSSLSNEIWASFNGGVSWSLCSLTGAFSPRAFASLSLDVDEYLYIAGGRNAQGAMLNDVYRSIEPVSDVRRLVSVCNAALPENGIGLTNGTTTIPSSMSWHVGSAGVIAPLPLLQRKNFLAIALTSSFSFQVSGSSSVTTVSSPKHALAVIGGEPLSPNDPVSAAAISLDAGLTWTTLPTPADFARTQAMTCYDASSSLVYSIGGMRSGAATNDVWVADDTFTWTRKDASSLPPLYGGSCTVSRTGRVYVMNALSDSNALITSVRFTDTNGRRWSTAASLSPSPSLYARGATVVAGYSPFGKKTVLWNVGGVRDNVATNAVWISTDESASWTQLTQTASFVPRTNAPVVVTSSNVLIIGAGLDTNGNIVSQIAVSLDGGITWGTATTGQPSSTYSSLAVDASDRLYVVGGANGVTYFTVATARVSTLAAALSLTAPTTVGLRCPAANACWPSIAADFSFIRLTGSASWPVRAQPTFELTISELSFVATSGTSMTAPAGSFVLFGGRPAGTSQSNDVWVSTDIGRTWQFAAGQYVDGSGNLQSSRLPDASFSPRYEAAECDDPNSDAAYSISGSRSNVPVVEVWYSENGLLWSQQGASTYAFPARTFSSCVVDSRGNVFLVGGLGADQVPLNDVWKSQDRGHTWTRSTQFAAWPARREHVVLDTASSALNVQLIYVLGGAASSPNDAPVYRNFLNDVWVSSDNAKSWQLVTGNAAWSGRLGHGGVITSGGVIVIYGGVTLSATNDRVTSGEMWTSLDGGYTWALCAAMSNTVGVSPRMQASLSLDAEENLFVAAGSSSTNPTDSSNLLSDVWVSTFSLMDTTSLSAKCGAVSIPARGTGLRCYPNQVCVEKRSLTMITMSAAAPWSERLQPAWQTVLTQFTYTSTQGVSVSVPAGSLVLYGGSASANDVWVTTDRGQSWDVVAGTDMERVPAIRSSSPDSSFSARLGAAVCEDPSSDRAYSISGVISGSAMREVWATDNTITWTQLLTPTSSFSPRLFAGCVVDTKGHVYMTGGSNVGSTVFYNDVWTSVDRGQTWRVATTAAEWAPRQEGMDLVWHSALFEENDPIWMMGGYGSAEYNDVWVSTDGARTYTQLTTAPWPTRWGGSAVVSTIGVIAVFGGRTGTDKYLSDLWFSVDGGYTWGQSLDASRSISERAETALTLDGNGFLFVATGIASNADDRVPLTDVYRSSFSLDDAQRVIKSIDLTAPLYGVGLRCVGGASCRSARSITMLKMTDAAPWAARIQPAVAVLQSDVSYGKPLTNVPTTAPAGSFVFYGGRYLQNDVWISSTQGETWDLISGLARTPNGAVVERSSTPDGSFAARYTDATCDDVSTGALYSISGVFAQSASAPSSSQLARQVWRSFDGKVWNQVLSSSSDFVARWWSGCTVLSTGTVLLVGGTTQPGMGSGSLNDVWSSDDQGVTWQQVTSAALWESRQEFMMVSQKRSVSGKSRDIVWVMGGARLASDMYFNDVYVSSDAGRSWAVVTSEAPWSARWGAQAVITTAGVIAFFGGKSATGYSSTLWVSFDGGAGWYRVTTSLPPRVEASLVLDRKQYLYVIAGSDAKTEYNDVFRSTLSLTDSRRLARISGTTVPEAGVGLLAWPAPASVNLGALAGMIFMVLFIGVSGLLSYLYYRWTQSTYGSFRWPTAPVRADLWVELRQLNYCPCFTEAASSWRARFGSGDRVARRSNGLLGTRALSDDTSDSEYAPPSARFS